MTTPQIILASTSPFRKMLLEKLGLPFTTIAPEVDERAAPSESPADLVQRLALAKAEAVAHHHPKALVIGSDQVAVHRGEILGKPGSHARAREQLAAFSGNAVTFYTGLALVGSEAGVSEVDLLPYTVHFRTLSADQIERYLKAEQPYQCAGSFKSEGLGITLFSRLEGDDPNTLIGLPLIRLTAMLALAGIPLP
ncbi:MAG: septum formation inhibitor Maf [Gammaproteobacteria bacterium]|nr:septum formation inhibitor Maf [Gammaproteobacteria bacterium]